MGKRGPAPKPSALKLVQGTYRKDRAVANEPKPESKAPSCPTWLHPEAKREWRRLAPELERLGILTTLDRSVFAGYCQAWAEWWDLDRLIKEVGITQKSDTGYVSMRPEVSMRDKAFEKWMKAAVQIGLSPSSRSRVNVPEKKEDDNPFAKFASKA